MKDENKTKKQLVEELAELRKREKRFKTFFANAPDYRFFLLDRELKVVAANRAVLEHFSSLFGVRQEDLIGRSFPELIPGFEASGRHEKYLEVLKTGIPFYVKEIVSTPEPGDVRLSLLVFKAGEVLGVIAADVTERVRAERALRENERKYVTLVEQANDGVVILQDGRIKFASKAGADIVGRRPDELVGMNIEDAVPPEHGAEISEKHRLRMQGHSIPPYETKLLHKNGSTIDVEISSKVMEFEGRPASLATIRDTTERKRTEQALEESEKRFRALFEGSLDATFLADPDSGEVADANPAACELLLMDQEEIVGLHYTKLFPSRLGSYAREKWRETVEGGEEPTRLEALALRSDGTEVPVEGLAQIIQIDGVPFVHGSFRDVSKRKEAEDVLRRSEERYRVFFDESPTALWEIDASSAKKFCNRLRSEGVRDIKAYFEEHPEEAARCEKMVKLVEMNKASVELLEADSKEEVFRNLNRILPKDTSPPFSLGIVAMAQDETSFERHVTSVTLKGKEKHFLYKWATLPGSEETFSRMLVSLVDVTDRVQLEHELLRTQKLESLGVLAGGIAHDFNNLLTAISTNLSMALMYGNLEDDISDMLGDAEKASYRAKNLTQQLLAFAKGGRPVKRTIPVGKLLGDTAEFALSGSNVRSVCRIPQGLWNISADEGQIGQVIHNLVINADQAMPGGGEIQVSAENVLVGRDDRLPLQEGRYVKLSVADQGIGVPKENLDRIFDPFFTTKKKGSGLGLATCFTIVNNHGGHIRVDSREDMGTRVDVFLPASEETLQVEEREGEGPVQGEGRVLLIDDEEMIRRSAGEMLRRFGYEVALAKDGEEAVRQYRRAAERGRPFHAVIMDLTIRGGNGGRETLEEILKIDPGAKVIVSSGYSDDPVMASYELYGFRDVITKPYKIERVGEILRRVMSEPS